MLPALSGSAGSASIAGTTPIAPAAVLRGSTATARPDLWSALKSLDFGDIGRLLDFGLATAEVRERRAGLHRSPNLRCLTSLVGEH